MYNRNLKKQKDIIFLQDLTIKTQKENYEKLEKENKRLRYLLSPNAPEKWFNDLLDNIEKQEIDDERKLFAEQYEEYLIAYSDLINMSINTLGKWMSAALEDPNTCQKMKNDINIWFKGINKSL